MYYTLQEDMPAAGYRRDISSIAVGHSCYSNHCEDSHQTIPKMVATDVHVLPGNILSSSSESSHFIFLPVLHILVDFVYFSEGQFSPVNVSKQSSSTDISLPTKKFVDRSQWLQKMVLLESNQARSTAHEHSTGFGIIQSDPMHSRNLAADHRASPSNEESWHQLGSDTSQFASTCNTSSELEFPTSARKSRKDGRSHHRQSESPLQMQLAKLKKLIFEQRQSYVRRLWREVEKIKKLEAMVPSVVGHGNETLTTLSSDESELMEYLRKRRLKYNIKDSERPKNKPSRRHNNSEELIDTPISGPCKQQTRDFCQVFPSPAPTECLEAVTKVSVGLQTTALVVSEEETREGGQARKTRKPIGWVIPLSRSKVKNSDQRQLSLQVR